MSENTIHRITYKDGKPIHTTVHRSTPDEPMHCVFCGERTGGTIRVGKEDIAACSTCTSKGKHRKMLPRAPKVGRGRWPWVTGTDGYLWYRGIQLGADSHLYRTVFSWPEAQRIMKAFHRRWPSELIALRKRPGLFQPKTTYTLYASFDLGPFDIRAPAIRSGLRGL